MTESPRSSATEDVSSAIQEAIDAPRLPFPDRNLRRDAEPDGLEARVTKLEAGIEFQRNIAEIRTGPANHEGQRAGRRVGSKLGPVASNR